MDFPHAEAFGGEIEGITGVDLDEEAVANFYGDFTRTKKVVTVYSQGVNQSAHGTDKVNAIINCHLATGRIGRPGMAPFSVTGQPKFDRPPRIVGGRFGLSSKEFTPAMVQAVRDRNSYDGIRALFPGIVWQQLAYAHEKLSFSDRTSVMEKGVGHPYMARTEVLGWGVRL